MNGAEIEALVNYTLRIVSKLNVPYHIQDEAFSEALVGLAVALSTFDEERGVKIQTWVYRNVRDFVRNWQQKTYRDLLPHCGGIDMLDVGELAYENIELEWIVGDVLDSTELAIVSAILDGLGYAEMGKRFRLNGKQINAKRKEIGTKLQAALVA